jgi:hypothetical protein
VNSGSPSFISNTANLLTTNITIPVPSATVKSVLANGGLQSIEVNNA